MRAFGPAHIREGREVEVLYSIVSHDFWVAAEDRNHDDPVDHFLSHVTVRHVDAHTEMRSALGRPAIADVALHCSAAAAASTSSSSDLTTSHLWTNEVMQFEAERGRRYSTVHSNGVSERMRTLRRASGE